MIAYSGDTQWTDSLLEASAHADLFICEGYTFDKVVKFHLDYTSLASHRERLSCKRVVLTHMSEDMLSRAEEAMFETAYDGLTVTL